MFGRKQKATMKTVATFEREAADRERDLNAEREKARKYQDALQEISAGAWRGYMNASEYAEAVLTDG